MTLMIGDFIVVAYGASATQPARIEGFTKTGKLVIRRFNKSRNEWYVNTTKIDTDLILDEYFGPELTRYPTQTVVKYCRKTDTYTTVGGMPLPELR